MARGSGQEFMNATRHARLQLPDQQRGLPQPPLEALPAVVGEAVVLPPPEEFLSSTRLGAAGTALGDLLARRTSLRAYAEAPLALDEFAFLLWATQGVKGLIERRATLRPVPSAGARHAFETRVRVHRVAGLAAGLYHYDALRHRLLPLATADDWDERLVAACYDQRFLAASAATFLWVAVPYRMTWRYSDRGYRYLHLDAGHVAQNLYLAAEAVGAGACAVAAFDDQAANALLELDGRDQFLIYLAAVGKRA